MNTKKEVIKYMIIVMLTILGLSLGVVLVWCLPNKVIEKNYEKSMVAFEKEGYSWESFFDYAWGGNIDNAMDYVILSTTIPIDDRGPVYNAVYCNDYARYWHGYLLYLRPLMLLFSYTQIRYLFLVVHMLMLVFIFDLLRKRLGYSIAYGWIASMIMVRINILAFSIQFSSIFFVLYGVIIYILLKYRKVDVGKASFILLLSGMLTSYVDLLTAPLITLGVPLIFIVCINIKEKAVNITNIKTIIVGSICWAIGYIGMWACKWPLMGLVLKQNVVNEITGQIALRSGSQSYIVDGREVTPSFIRAVIYNMFAFIPNVFGLSAEVDKDNIIHFAIVSFILGAIMVLILIRIIKLRTKKEILALVPLLIVGLIPLAWFFVIKEHSCIHQFYTYRILMILLLAIYAFLATGLDGRLFIDKHE